MKKYAGLVNLLVSFFYNQGWFQTCWDGLGSDEKKRIMGEVQQIIYWWMKQEG